MENSGRIASMSWLQVKLAAWPAVSLCFRVAGSRFRSSAEREAQCFADIGPKSSRSTSSIGDLAPGREVVDRPFASRSWIIRTISSCSSGCGRRSHTPSHLASPSAGFAASCTSVCCPMAISSPNDGADLVHVAGAAHVPSSATRVRRCRAGRRHGPAASQIERRRAGTIAAATRAAGRRRCPAQARAWRRTR